jgi:pseudouridine-5'-phosphate glycosidase
VTQHGVCGASLRSSPFAEANLKMGLQSGILVAVPIPTQHAALASSVEAAIQKSLLEIK